MFSPNNLVLSPSRAVSAWLWLPHLAALTLLWSSSAPLWLKIPISLAVLASGFYADLLHARLKLPRSPHSIRVDARSPGLCRLQLQNRQELETHIQDDSIITASFVILRLRIPEARISRVILICRWNCEPNAFRRLRVILRFQPHSAGPSHNADKAAGHE